MRAAFADSIQIAWDATSLSTYKACARRYKLAILDGWRTKSEARALTFGTWFHQSLEHYHKELSNGASHEKALLSAARFALSVSYGVPDPPDEKYRTRFGLLRAVVWHLDHFADDPAKTIILANGLPAVELSFRFETDLQGPSGPILLCGHMDRLVEFAGDAWGTDYKTTHSQLGPNYAERYNPNNQVSLYTFAGKVAFGFELKGVIIDAIQLAVNFARFQRFPSQRSQGSLDEWYDGAMRYISRALEDTRWDMNDEACFMCQFKSICSKDPKVRDTFLHANFTKVHWDPLKVR